MLGGEKKVEDGVPFATIHAEAFKNGRIKVSFPSVDPVFLLGFVGEIVSMMANRFSEIQKSEAKEARNGKQRDS